jgi:hypothetical protein
MTEIQAHIREPSGISRQRWPLTWGVPLAQGQWRPDHAINAIDSNERARSICATPLATWPDASVKWALIDTQIDIEAGERLDLRLQFGDTPSPPPANTSLSHSVDDDHITIETGALTAQIARSGPRLFTQLMRGNLSYLSAGNSGEFSATDAHGKRYIAHVESLEIEEQNPLRLVVHARGSYIAHDEVSLFSWQLRIYFYAGHSYFKVYHTFVHDQPTDFVHLAQLRFALPLSFNTPCSAALGARSSWFGHGYDMAKLEGETSLVQWHAERHALFADDRRQDARSNGHGWGHLADNERGVTLKLRRPWQNYPNSVVLNKESIALELYPDLRDFAPPKNEEGRRWTEIDPVEAPLFDGPLRIPQGMAKTHEFFVHCGPPQQTARAVDTFCLAFEQPLFPVLDSEYYTACGVLGPLQPYRDAYWPLELKLRRSCRFPNGMGFIDSGDHVRMSTVDGRTRTQTCKNLAYELPRSLFYQFLRCGDMPTFAAGEAAIMHLMDIDTVHYSAENPQSVGGPYCEWSQNHHYADSNEEALACPQTSHTWLGSLLDYYFLTGYRRAKEVAESCADFCRLNAPYSWKQQLSSDLHQRALDPDQDWPFSTRVAGWPLVAMSTYYEAFGDERFLRSMEALVDLFASWQDPEGRWREQIGSFNRGATPFMNASVLQGLMRYHRCTGDVRALQILLHGTRFLVDKGRTLEGIFYYKESALSDTPHGSTAMLLEPLAFAYQQSNDPAFLDAGYRLFCWLVDNGGISTYMLKDIFAFMPLLERHDLLDSYRAPQLAPNSPNERAS